MPALCFALVAALASLGASKADLESEVKAGFLFNFAKFTTWPAEAYESESSPFLIGVQGNNPVARELEAKIEGQTLHGRPIGIVRLRRLSDVSNEHLVFAGGRLTATAENQLGDLCGRPILTVTESPGAAEESSIINLYSDNNKIAFEVNRKCESSGGLRISSKVLRLARIIDPKSSDEP